MVLESSLLVSEEKIKFVYKHLSNKDVNVRVSALKKLNEYFQRGYDKELICQYLKKYISIEKNEKLLAYANKLLNLKTMPCPRCKASLLQQGMNYYTCKKCAGVFYLGEQFDSIYANSLYRIFSVIDSKTKLYCPKCNSSYFKLKYKHGHLMIELCSECNSIWMDRKKVDAFKKVLAQHKNELNSEISKEEMDKYSDDLKSEYKLSDEDVSLDKGQKIFQIITGFPILKDQKPLNPPIATWVIMGLNLFLYLMLHRYQLNYYVYHWGYLPSSHNYLKAFTSMFTHGSFWHVAGNMYFLWITGTHVEDKLGVTKYLLLYFISGLLGGTISGLLVAPNVHHIGASVAVAGVMSAFVVLLPNAVLVTRWLYFLVIPMYSWMFMGVYIALQFWISLDKNSNVSWVGHLSGIVFGFILIYLLKGKSKTAKK